MTKPGKQMGPAYAMNYKYKKKSVKTDKLSEHDHQIGAIKTDNRHLN